MSCYGLIARENRARRQQLPQRHERSEFRWSCIQSSPMAQRSKRERYLPRAGPAVKIVGCFGLTEPKSRQATPAGNGKRARRRSTGGWRLHGSKNVDHQTRPIADIMIIWAKVVEDGARSVRFAVSSWKRGNGRFCRRPAIEGKFSLRASSTGEIVMDEVFRAGGRICCRARAALRGPFGCLKSGRGMAIAWGALGAAEFLLAVGAAVTHWIASSSGVPLAAKSTYPVSSWRICRARSRWDCRGAFAGGAGCWDDDAGDAGDDFVDQAQFLHEGAGDRSHFAGTCTAANGHQRRIPCHPPCDEPGSGETPTKAPATIHALILGARAKRASRAFM